MLDKYQFEKFGISKAIAISAFLLNVINNGHLEDFRLKFDLKQFSGKKKNRFIALLDERSGWGLPSKAPFSG